ncbi:hypothetical protein BGW37DRAFT_299307 [Umbelopsis sp. PMI_123]|nr:hypothetical protein BGW37DRAFT_299307 [Umbelopsis sp. PMI_123]
MADPIATSSQARVQETSTDEAVAHIVSNTISKDISNRLLQLLRAFPLAIYLGKCSNGTDPLDQLDPQEQSLGYLFFITARCISDSHSDARDLLRRLLFFLNTFNPEQIRLAPERYTLIADALSNLANRLESPIIPVRPLRIAIQRFCGDRPIFTSLHAPLAKYALLAKLYKDPLPVLDNDIEHVDATLDVNIESFLSYYYYGAMIYIGNKRFGRALEFLSVAVSAPSQAVSLIQLECFKKYVLLSLLHYGKLQPLPKYTATIISKFVRRHCRPYIGFADVYESQSIEKLTAALEKRREVFEKDNNWGLADQCLRALQQQKIQGLTRTYITLSVSDIAEKVGFTGDDANAEVKKNILEMVEQGSIFASIEHTGRGDQDEMVSFHDNPNRYDTSESLAILDEKISQAVVVGERLSRQDKSTALDRDFMSRMMLMVDGTQMSAMYEDEVDIMVDDEGRLYA